MYDPKIGFRAVGNKVLVNVRDTFGDLPQWATENRETTLKERLIALGVREIQVFNGSSIVTIALMIHRTAQYRRGARISESPSVVDCSSFTKWAYAQVGLWLPRLAIEQQACCWVVDPHCCQPDFAGGDDGAMKYPKPYAGLMDGDLIFSPGYKSKARYWREGDSPVGHAGLVHWSYGTANWQVIHASNGGVRVDHLSRFIANETVVSFGRPVRDWWGSGSNWWILTVPDEWELENAGKLRWLVLQ